MTEIKYFEKNKSQYDEDLYVRVKDSNVDLCYIDDFLNSHDVNRIYEVTDMEYYLVIKEFSSSNHFPKNGKVMYNEFNLTNKDSIDVIIKYINKYGK